MPQPRQIAPIEQAVCPEISDQPTLERGTLNVLNDLDPFCPGKTRQTLPNEEKRRPLAANGRQYERLARQRETAQDTVLSRFVQGDPDAGEEEACALGQRDAAPAGNYWLPFPLSWRNFCMRRRLTPCRSNELKERGAGPP